MEPEEKKKRENKKTNYPEKKRKNKERCCVGEIYRKTLSSGNRVSEWKQRVVDSNRTIWLPISSRFQSIYGRRIERSGSAVSFLTPFPFLEFFFIIIFFHSLHLYVFVIYSSLGITYPIYIYTACSSNPLTGNKKTHKKAKNIHILYSMPFSFSPRISRLCCIL
jgi:hypothetical protein